MRPAVAAPQDARSIRRWSRLLRWAFLRGGRFGALLGRGARTPADVYAAFMRRSLRAGAEGGGA